MLPKETFDTLVGRDDAVAILYRGCAKGARAHNVFCTFEEELGEGLEIARVRWLRR